MLSRILMNGMTWAKSTVRTLRRKQVGDAAKIPDASLYRPVFSPWLGYNGFADVIKRVAPYSLVSADRLWVLLSLARQARWVDGDFWECGVYKGGTAMLLERIVADIPGKRIHLFDTFAGMPDTDRNRDRHRRGDFGDTSLDAVRGRVGVGSHVCYHPGLIPDTFSGLESERIAMAHVDVDIFRSVTDCCDFIYPRLSPAGILVFDDYGFPSCPGARAAVDGFFADKREEPLIMPTGQAVVVKLP